MKKHICAFLFFGLASGAALATHTWLFHAVDVCKYNSVTADQFYDEYVGVSALDEEDIVCALMTEGVTMDPGDITEIKIRAKGVAGETSNFQICFTAWDFNVDFLWERVKHEWSRRAHHQAGHTEWDVG